MEENNLTSLNKRTILAYIIIALGFSWACWIPSLLWAKQADYVRPTIATLGAKTPFKLGSGKERFPGPANAVAQ